MKSKRAKACEFSQKEREAIKERDGNCCIICGTSQSLTIAHYISRTKGLGIRQNGALFCFEHHGMMDNGSNTEMREALKAFFKGYLEGHYPGFSDEERKYKKWTY